MMNSISQEQISTWIEKIHEFSLPEDNPNGNTRLTLSPEDMAAREYLMEEMKAVGLDVSVDAVGNITGRAKGDDLTLPEVWTGSHIDTVIHGGKFDGVAGVVAGLEVLRNIVQNHIPHKRSICLKIYTGEEGALFSGGCVGSRAIANQISKEDLEHWSDGMGHTAGSLLRKNGFNLDMWDQVRKTEKDIYAAVELHIEQGTNLEKEGKTIGIVDGICAPTNMILTVHGEQSHSGGSSMAARHDAFMAAAEIALSLEKAATHGTSAYTTGTVGFVQVEPNAENVVPGKVTMSIDVRDCEKESKDIVVAAFLDDVKRISSKRGVKIHISEKCNDAPTLSDNHIKELIASACENKNISYMHTFSGPYHDSLFIGKIAPVGMIFVPSKAGISHNPEEWTSYEDITKGTDVLFDVLLKLANE